MASLNCCCLPRRGHIQLADDRTQRTSSNPPPRLHTILTEAKQTSISAPYRRLRRPTVSGGHGTILDDEESSLETCLLSEQEKKEGTLITIAETESLAGTEIEDNRASAAYSDRSSTVSLPSTRITSMASTWTGQSRDSRAGDFRDSRPISEFIRDSRASELSLPPPPYSGPAPRGITEQEWEAFVTAGDYFRDIQRRIADQPEPANDGEKSRK